MAIYHCSIKPVSRRGGRSVTAAAAYRAGVKILDDRTGEIHDYTRKHGVEYTWLAFPSGVEMTREQLWNAAERSEKRKDARVAREFELALPTELTSEQRRELAKDFAKSLVDKYGVAADVAIHAPSRNGDQRNHHAHILITTRQVSSQGMMDKTDLEREDKALRAQGKPSGREQIEALRAEWATMCNAALKRAGQNEQVDHRSLKAQGITRMPTVHLGCAATAMERRGIRTELGDTNRDISQSNVLIATLGTWKPAEFVQDGDEFPRAAEAAIQGDLFSKAAQMAEKTSQERLEAEIAAIRAEAAEARKAQVTLLSNEAAMQVSSADSPQPAQAEASKEPEAAIQGDVYSFDDLMKAGKARRAAQARQEPQEPPKAAEAAPHVSTAEPSKPAHQEPSRTTETAKEQEDALLREAGLYGKTAEEAKKILNTAQEQYTSAGDSLFRVKQEQGRHNYEVDNMGFFKRTFKSGEINKNAKEIDKKFYQCTFDYEQSKEKVMLLEKVYAILENREREEREAKAKHLAETFEHRKKNANSLDEYREIFREIAKRASDLAHAVVRVLDEWAQPYIDLIKKAGSDHKKAFDKCVKLAERDVTTDKDLLQDMDRQLDQAMKGTRGTVGDHMKQVQEMMNAIRLHDDRRKGFDLVAGGLLQQQQQKRSRGFSR